MKHWSPQDYRWDKNAAAPWRRYRRWFFWRFAMGFGFLLLLAAGLITLLSRLINGFFGGPSLSPLAVVGGIALAVTLPILAVAVSWALIQRVATPVAQVMAVTEAVAGGDLSARVESNAAGRLGRLSRSVNHMVEELERGVEQRRRMTADIAHELRTPLQIIQGNLEGILDGIYEPTGEHIENTLEETRLLARLVEDLGTLSLAEAGQLPLIIEPVDVAELLADVETSFSGQAELAGVGLRVELAPGRPLTILADVQRLSQVLGNLVANALRHTPAGGSITLRGSTRDGAVCLEIVDSGEGIPEADLPYIFGRFWRGDRARTHAAGTGGGLGLAIAQQLVQAHGGTIEVESAIGAGSTFRLILPAAGALSN